MSIPCLGGLETMANMLTEVHVENLFAAIIIIAVIAAIAAELVNFIPELMESLIKRIKNKSIIDQQDLLTLQKENILELNENMDTKLDRSDLGTKWLKGRFFSK